jgi:hypothetical protein
MRTTSVTSLEAGDASLDRVFHDACRVVRRVNAAHPHPHFQLTEAAFRTWSDLPSGDDALHALVSVDLVPQWSGPGCEPIHLRRAASATDGPLAAAQLLRAAAALLDVYQDGAVQAAILTVQAAKL